MKTLSKISAAFIIALLLIAAKPLVQNFLGNWIYATTASAFTLILSQSGTALSGSHCSVQQSGGRIDCGLDASDLSIAGTVNDSDSLIVSFKSFSKGLSGTAKIKMINSTTLEWTIINKPQGEFYLPMNAVLTKQ